MRRFDEIMMSKVRTRAEFDFQCPASELTVVKLDQGTYGATGCGKRASYVGKDSEACSSEQLPVVIKQQCQVVSDSFVTDPSEQ